MSLTVNLLIVRRFSIGTKKLTVLKVSAPIADNIGLKGGQTSTMAEWTL